MPNTERAFELLDDNRFDEQEPEYRCLWCNAPIEENAVGNFYYCSSTCDAAAQRDSDEDGL